MDIGCWRIASVGVLLSVVSLSAFAAPDCAAPVGRVVSVEGVMDIRSADEDAWRQAAAEQGLCEGDSVRVGANSRGGIYLAQVRSTIRMDQDTHLRLSGADADGFSVDVQSGAANFTGGAQADLAVATPFVKASAVGAEFSVAVLDSRSNVSVYEGEVRLNNSKGSLELESGAGAAAEADKAPYFVEYLKPDDAVQWALHYEPVLAALLSSGRDDQPDDLVQAFQGGFSVLDFGAPRGNQADFFNYRAALYLSVGRIDKAEPDLRLASNIAPNNADTLAIRAIVALAHNNRKEAQELADRAKGSGPQRLLPWLANSYARQAHFDLKGAEAAVRSGLKQDPENGLLLARLAELLLANGELSAGDTAVSKATANSPDVGLVHRTQGFSQLLKLELDKAKAAFRRAIELDQGDPMARLGLGLAMIRAGDLAAGREELEIAVMLHPRNSVLRSYLGKAYFEEREDAKALVEYELAAALDPNDPTPWLYRGLLRQQENRPVEALADLDRSVELNQNRAVYRARAQLDSDLAARGASVGETHRELRFEQRALLDGWRSAAVAPDDYAGHRLLAEVYSVLPRHEEARVSESLQAQLLQPLNHRPVQPLMVETRLLAPESMLPTKLGHNEYSGLFQSDGVSARITGSVGEQGILGDEVLVSGLHDKAAISIGQFHYERNAGGGLPDQDQDILVAFAQFQPTRATSLQVELRSSDIEELSPASTLNSINRDDTWDTRSARLGVTQRWSSDATLIGSLIYHQGDNDAAETGSHDPGDPRNQVDISGDASADSITAELRQDWRIDDWRLTAGVGYVEEDRVSNVDIHTERSFTLPDPPFPGLMTLDAGANEDLTYRQMKAYLYTWWDFNPQWAFNLGLSYDSVKQSGTSRGDSMLVFRADFPPLEIPLALDSVDRDAGLSKGQWNPKLGFIWRPQPQTSIRGAVFRYMSQPGAEKRSIEPTHVAGFNQMFSGIRGESYWRYGLGLDHKFSSSLSAGTEVSLRDRVVPGFTVNEGFGEEENDRVLGRAYVAITPSKRTALGLEYFYESRIFGDTTDDETHRVPLSLSYFHPGGLFGTATASYVSQTLEWFHNAGRHDDDFVNVDLRVGYRLPNHRAIVSLQVNNLFDEDFDYRETDPNNPLFVTERSISLRATVDF